MTTQRKNFTHVPITVGAVSTLALAENAQRAWALLINDSDETIYLKFSDPAVMNEGIRLNAQGGSFEIAHESGFFDIRDINAICASGGKTLLVTHA